MFFSLKDEMCLSDVQVRFMRRKKKLLYLQCFVIKVWMKWPVYVVNKVCFHDLHA